MRGEENKREERRICMRKDIGRNGEKACGEWNGGDGTSCGNREEELVLRVGMIGKNG